MKIQTKLGEKIWMIYWLIAFPIAAFGTIMKLIN
jgi:hypothetical protein